MRIRLFGLDHEKIRQFRANVEEALGKVGVEAAIERVDKIDEITMSGVLKTPALMIGDRIVCEGRIASTEELAEWIHHAAAASEAVAVQ